MSKRTKEFEDEANAAGSKVTPSAHPVAHKSKLEKTQSLLTVISTSIGLLGVAGSLIAMGLSTFYTGAIEVRPQPDSSDLVVRVYSKEGRESVFHTKHIEVMPGDYHLEIASSDGRVAHADTRVKFHKTNTVRVVFQRSVKAGGTPGSSSADAGKPGLADVAGNIIKDLTSPPQKGSAAEQQEQTVAAEAPKNSAKEEESSDRTPKKRWWQIWKKGPSQRKSDEDKSDESK